ncbi:MAG: HD domain-containing protein [bacterium]|nr:HD domain-containing protein [bacterium]
MTKGAWKYISFIFSRPFLAAILVGSGIHLFLGLAEYLAKGINHAEVIAGNFSGNIIYGLIHVLIPYLIPWIVTTIGSNLTIQKERASLLKFPGSNPGIVMKLDIEGNISYMNPSAELFLDNLNIGREDGAEILPPEYRSKIGMILGKNRTLSLIHTIEGKTIDFTFRTFRDEDSIFVSGHDISETVNLKDRLSRSYDNIMRLYDFMDRTFTRYDPLTFKLEEHYKAIMERLLKNKGEDDPNKASFIFLTFKAGDGTFSGHIHSKMNNIVIKDPELITIVPEKEKVAINFGGDEVVWSNWEEEGKTLSEYQSHFHAVVREKTGTIERYATYISGQVAIIAFYHGKLITRFDAYLIKGLAVFANSLKKISEETKQTEEAFIYTIDTLARASQANDEDRGDHETRMKEYAKLLAEALGMDDDFIHKIYHFAQMHDVGKIYIHPDVLKKEGPLSENEYEAIKLHTFYGAHILGDSPRLKMAAEIARTHHEKYNGTGYPQGLKGTEIPLPGRIVKLADVYDALRQKRSFKSTLSHEQAVSIILKGDEKTDPSDFDPLVLDAFTRVADRMNEIFERFGKR